MNPYLILGLLVAWGLSLAGVGAWQNNAGHVAERSAWQDRESAELRLANATIIDLNVEARAAEYDHATALAAISTDYQGRLTDANKQRATDAAAVRAGTLRLRDPYPAGLRACGSVAAETGAGAGGRDGRAAGELSAEITGDLFELVDDADRLAEQLGACQRVVQADRAM